MPKPSRSTKRSSRPIDLVAPPPKRVNQGQGSTSSLRANLPKSWITLFDVADDWPYPDPDSNGLADPESSFIDFPSDPSSLPEIEPFSEDEPWGKMIAETNRDYELFSHYRAQGITRTKAKTANHFSLKRATVELKAGERNWDARCRSWDDYREKVYTAELILGVKEMAHKHAEIARGGIEALSVAFEAIIESMENPEDREELLAEINSLPIKQKLAIAQRSAQVIPNLMSAERLSRGLPTEISAELHLNETRVTIQTTDDLASILLGLVGPLAVAQSTVIDGEIVEDDA